MDTPPPAICPPDSCNGANRIMVIMLFVVFFNSSLVQQRFCLDIGMNLNSMT